MYRVHDEVMISASHQIPLADGRLEAMHGHNWRIVVHICAATLDGRGLVVDFGEIRQVLWRVVEPFDHRNLDDLPPFDTMPSTAENLARVVAERLAPFVDDGRCRLDQVDVWMTDTGCASWILPAPAG